MSALPPVRVRRGMASGQWHAHCRLCGSDEYTRRYGLYLGTGQYFTTAIGIGLRHVWRRHEGAMLARATRRGAS